MTPEGGPARAGERHRRSLGQVCALVGAFVVVQIVVGLVSHSLAVLSDAGHMATDALGMGMSLAAIHVASKGSVRTHRTFGWYRLEILAALFNAALLFGVAAYVVVEAIHRVRHAPDVASPPVLAIGLSAIVVNLVAFQLLRAGAVESINLKAASVEVLGDLLGAVGVVVAAVLIAITHWRWIDSTIGAAIGLFILPRAARLGASALRVLLQAAPAGLDLESVHAALRGIEGVVDVHDLHVWTLTSEMEVASAHIMVRASADHHSVLDAARLVLETDHHIHHATLQIEPDDHTGCEDLTW